MRLRVRVWMNGDEQLEGGMRNVGVWGHRCGSQSESGEFGQFLIWWGDWKWIDVQECSAE